VPEAISNLFAAILQSTKTHKWWWAGGGGAALVAIAAVVVVFGGFFGPSGKAICTATLTRARDYGVVPMTASLLNNKAASTEVKGRRICVAQADNDQYNMAVDVKCDKLKNKECISLYSVERADGLSIYQVRIESDAEKAAEAAGQSAGNAIPPTDTSGNSMDADTAVDNGGASTSTPQQQ
jgi:hypothetical protein